MMQMDYDVIIVGAGASGVFASYELTKLATSAKILMIDKGRALSGRHCPITEGRVPNCVKCSPCHIMNGYGGAGTLSDGKYNITTEFGGELHRKVGKETALDLMPSRLAHRLGQAPVARHARLERT
jgi:uncharacterized FAD-dependent dehydrogenase